MNRSRSTRALGVMLLGVGMMLSACGDSEVQSNTQVTPTTTGRVDTNNTTVPTIGDEYLLVPVGATTIQGDVSQTVPLKVYLYSKKTGAAVKDQIVKYEIIEGGDGGSSLTALNSTTNELGEAEAGLRTGAAEGTIKVKVDHASAAAIEFTVQVSPLPKAQVEVTLVNSAPSIMQLRDIEVRLYNNSGTSCNEFLPLRQQPDGLTSVTMPSVQDRPLFENLDIQPKYMVTAVARGQRGQIAAAGCVEDIRVAASDTSRVELALQLIPLNPVGRYDVDSFWDFSQAIADSGTVGNAIIRVLNVFENPGQAIYDEALNLVRNYLSGIVASGIDLFFSVTGLDDDIQDAINNFIEGNAVLSKVRDAGRDLRTVVTNLHVHSELTIGKLSSSYEFTGTDNWLGLTLYWRWNCDANSPPDCGAIELQPDANGTFADLGVLSSQWSGRVVAYDQLQIDQHPLTLRYGRLIIFVLNEVILPQLTNGNAHSMSEAFAYWIGCDSLARSITGSDGEICALGACIQDTTISGICTTAVTTVFGFADALVRNLEFDMGLTIGGTAKLIEEDSDGFVDKMENGTYQGYITSSGQNGQTQVGAQINANWSATRTDFMTGGL